MSCKIDGQKVALSIKFMGKSSAKGKGQIAFVQDLGTFDKWFWKILVKLWDCYSHKTIFSREEVTMKIAEDWFLEDKTISSWTVIEKDLRGLVSTAWQVWWT